MSGRRGKEIMVLTDGGGKGGKGFAVLGRYF